MGRGRGPRPRGGTPINPTTKTSQTPAPQHECNRLKRSKTHNDRCRRNREKSNEGTQMRRPSKVDQNLKTTKSDDETPPPSHQSLCCTSLPRRGIAARDGAQRVYRPSCVGYTGPRGVLGGAPARPGSGFYPETRPVYLSARFGNFTAWVGPNLIWCFGKKNMEPGGPVIELQIGENTEATTQNANITLEVTLHAYKYSGSHFQPAPEKNVWYWIR